MFFFPFEGFFGVYQLIKFSMFLLKNGSLLVSCSARWMNSFSSFPVNGLGNSLNALMLSLSGFAPSRLIILPVKRTLLSVVMFSFEMLRLMFWHLLRVVLRRLSSVG